MGSRIEDVALDFAKLTELLFDLRQELDLDRGKEVDVGPPHSSLPPPRWTYRSLCIVLEALRRVAGQRDVRVILHRGPTAGHEVILSTADLMDSEGGLLTAEAAYDARFP